MDHHILSSAQLAQHLRALRKARGLSQADLGARLGLSQSRIARMEGAPASISVDSLLQMLAALHVRLVLADGTGTGTGTTVVVAREPTRSPAPKVPGASGKSSSKRANTSSDSGDW